MRPKRVRRLDGQVVEIALSDETRSYALVCRRPLFAFYGRLFDRSSPPTIAQICSLPVVFKLFVMNYTVTDGRWPIVGRVALTPELKEQPQFFKQDALNGRLAIYHEVPELAPHYERPANLEECLGLERAAIWDPEHVEDRLRDHFAGRANRWIEQLRLRPELIPGIK